MAEGSDRRRRREAAGRRAEALAALILRLKGFRILARRMRAPVGEIDLIARRGRLIAFVEVKRRAATDVGLEAVTAPARRRIARAAAWWLAANPAYGGYTMRFDVIVLAPWSRPRHVVHAFEAEW